MYTLQLIRGRSYTGGGVKASAGRPLVRVKSEAAAGLLVASGRFALVDAPAPGGESKGARGPVAPEKMTEAQLDAYAAARGVDLAGLKKKADKLYRIQHAQRCGALLPALPSSPGPQ